MSSAVLHVHQRSRALAWRRVNADFCLFLSYKLYFFWGGGITKYNVWTVVFCDWWIQSCERDYRQYFVFKWSEVITISPDFWICNAWCILEIKMQYTHNTAFFIRQVIFFFKYHRVNVLTAAVKVVLGVMVGSERRESVTESFWVGIGGQKVGGNNQLDVCALLTLVIVNLTFTFPLLSCPQLVIRVCMFFLS